MKIKSLAMASVLALASLGALAQTGLPPKSFAFLADGSTTFNNGAAVGGSNADAAGPIVFSQTFSFTGLTAGSYDISGNISGTNLAFSSVKLNSGDWTLVPGTNNRFGIVSLTAETPLTVTVLFTTTGDAIYSGNMIATAAVPEPETYAMLLAGLGLMGSIVRRRNKANSA